MILHPCDWQHALFKGLKAVPDDGKPVSSFANRHDAFLQITRAIRDVAAVTDPLPPEIELAAPLDAVASAATFAPVLARVCSDAAAAAAA